jgi:predicted O-linked N-acetylglucosamine transferase (SPINDLY family)
MLHVLVDGLHDFNSIKILATRPARVQATWLGFASSTGQGSRRAAVSSSVASATAIDYIIADPVLLPPELEHSQNLTEHVVLLPICYQPQDENRNLRLKDMSELNDTHYLNILDHQFDDAESASASEYYQALWRAEAIFQHKASERLRLLKSVQPDNDEVATLMWYVSFNRQSKVTREAFEDWMQVSRQVINGDR